MAQQDDVIKSCDIELSIIAPMYNESANIQNTIESIQKVFKGFQKPWELIFVNDGSIDKTLEVALEWEKKIENLKVISYPVNQGRGRAIRTGFAHAKGRYIVTIDFDLSYSPDHIIRIYKELSDPHQMNDVVLASAYMEGGKTIGIDPKRLFISKLGNLILQYAFPQKIRTTTCILRGYKKEVLNSIELESNDKEIHLEILSKVFSLGFNIKEIPATLTSRKYGQSKFKFKQTAISHILFSLFEKPIVLFGLIGLGLMISGIFLGIYTLLLIYSGTLDPTRPFISLMIVFFAVGSQFFCFAFIASQNNHLRKDIYRLQKQVKILENSLNSKDNYN